MKDVMRGYVWGCIAGAPFIYAVSWFEIIQEDYASALALSLISFTFVILGTAILDQTQTPKGEEHNA